MKECLTENDFCDAHATCYDNNGVNYCQCNVGFFGNGKTCQGMGSSEVDVDMNINFYFNIDSNECTTNTHNCDIKAKCTNTFGSFTCECAYRSQGNGVSCTCEVGYSGSTCEGMYTINIFYWFYFQYWVGIRNAIKRIVNFFTLQLWNIIEFNTWVK